MNFRSRIRAALVAATILAIGIAGSASAYPTGSDANHASNWNDQFDHPATCVKYEPGSTNSAGTWYGSNRGFVLNPGNWEALVIKAGTVNDVFVHPTAFGLYLAASGKDVSHIIVCTTTQPEVTPSPTPTPEVTPTPSPSPTPTPSPSPTPTPTPPTPSASPTPTSSTSATPTPPSTITPQTTFSAQPTLPPTDTEPSPSLTPTQDAIHFLLVFGAAWVVWRAADRHLLGNRR